MDPEILEGWGGGSVGVRCRCLRGWTGRRRPAAATTGSGFTDPSSRGRWAGRTTWVRWAYAVATPRGASAATFWSVGTASLPTASAGGLPVLLGAARPWPSGPVRCAWARDSVVTLGGEM